MYPYCLNFDDDDEKIYEAEERPGLTAPTFPNPSGRQPGDGRVQEPGRPQGPGRGQEHDGRRPEQGYGPGYDHRPEYDGRKPEYDHRPDHDGRRPGYDHKPDHGRGPGYDHRPDHGHGPGYDHRPDHGHGPGYDHRPDHGRPPESWLHPGNYPPGEPPVFIPERPAVAGPGVFAVDPGAIYGCQNNYTYIWLANGLSFWMYITYVGRQSVAGYRWTRFGWTYTGLDLQSIESFSCSRLY